MHKEGHVSAQEGSRECTKRVTLARTGGGGHARAHKEVPPCPRPDSTHESAQGEARDDAHGVVRRGDEGGVHLPWEGWRVRLTGGASGPAR